MSPLALGILGALVGALFGGLIAIFNYKITVRAEAKANANPNLEDGKNDVLKAFAVRYLVNIAALVIVFLVRKVNPLPFEWTLIGTAVGLTLPGRLLLIHHAKQVDAEAALAQAAADKE